MVQLVRPLAKVSPFKLNGPFIQLITIPSVPINPGSICMLHSGHITILPEKISAIYPRAYSLKIEELRNGLMVRFGFISLSYYAFSGEGPPLFNSRYYLIDLPRDIVLLIENLTIS
jgi:hypothetical protein